VAIERVTDGFVIITGGLKQGDLLVTSGAEKLRTGAKVRMTRAPG
jgi:multidrug efflux pump subunit AcrA (membrane-fusion protein)